MARAPKTDHDRPSSRRVGALSALWPFVRPYRATALAALGALILIPSEAIGRKRRNRR